MPLLPTSYGSFSHIVTLAKTLFLLSIPLFVRQLHCQPTNTTSPPTNLSAEFSHLSMRYSLHPSGPDIFTLESFALAAITAMKEEALLDYEAPIVEYDFTDTVHPENPVRFTVDTVAETAAAVAQAKRSSLLWTLKTLGVQLMRSRYLQPLLFSVSYRRQVVYRGQLREKEEMRGLKKNGTEGNPGAVLSARREAAFDPRLSLDMVAPPNLTNATTTTVTLKPLSPSGITQNNDDPHYELTFNLLPTFLPALAIYESLLEILLLLAKLSADAPVPRSSVAFSRLYAWVFMIEPYPPAEAHPFQQFQAVAIVEAIARYYVLQGVWKEMSFEFLTDGKVNARGCVVRNTPAREWCQGLLG